jgi:hypothetical protein
MVFLTVAIPTWKRWSFLQKVIEQYVENPLISSLVICDESGDDIDEIKKSKWSDHPKLVLHKNPTRLGMYHNKRKCLEIAAMNPMSEWVSVLDSDNLFSDDFFETLHEAIEAKKNVKYVFASSHIIHLQKKTGETKTHTEHFSGMMINKKNWNDALNVSKWHFLLNDGNWTAHKDVIQCFNDKADEEQIRAVDSLLLAKQMVENGYTYFVVPNLKYIHTVHDDSEWIKTEEISLRLLRTTNWRIEN